MPPEYQNLVSRSTLAFGSGGTVSGSVYLNGETLLAVASPGTWTAALLTFEVTDGPEVPGAGSWYRLYSATTVVSAAPATAGTSIYYLDVANAPGVYWLRAFSGDSSAGTAQAADRTLTLLTRPV